MPSRGYKEHELLSPLFSTGTGHAKVHSPTPTSFPDPMGFQTTHTAPWMSAGSGDDVNDWDAESEAP